jgi:hypothetical protein
MVAWLVHDRRGHPMTDPRNTGVNAAKLAAHGL